MHAYMSVCSHACVYMSPECTSRLYITYFHLLPCTYNFTCSTNRFPAHKTCEAMLLLQRMKMVERFSGDVAVKVEEMTFLELMCFNKLGNCVCQVCVRMSVCACEQQSFGWVHLYVCGTHVQGLTKTL